MTTVFRVGVTTPALVVLWTVVVFFGTSEGWWKQSLAPRGDTAAFTDAAVKLVGVVSRPLGMVHSSYTWAPTDGATLSTFYDVESKPTPHYRYSAAAAAAPR